MAVVKDARILLHLMCAALERKMSVAGTFHVRKLISRLPKHEKHFLPPFQIHGLEGLHHSFSRGVMAMDYARVASIADDRPGKAPTAEGRRRFGRSLPLHSLLVTQVSQVEEICFSSISIAAAMR